MRTVIWNLSQLYRETCKAFIGFALGTITHEEYSDRLKSLEEIYCAH